ncbi:hypothetical protein C8Q79DRAFT_992409 [Trametes meyenii]|nr:hypothetical protein C8Q79DRAFT_992409 [Trametes meyenii]
MFDVAVKRGFVPRLNKCRVADAVPALFDATLLQDELVIQTAIGALESQLVDSASIGGVVEVVEELLSSPHCFEFVLSATNHHIYEKIRNAILHSYPNTPEQFSSSLADRLLARLSLFLLFLPYPDPSESPPNLRSHKQKIDSSGVALKALTTLYFDVDSVQEEASPTTLDEFLDSGIFVKTKRKQKHKKGKRPPAPSGADLKAIVDYCGFEPSTKEESMALASGILEDLCTILKEYMEMLRLPGLAPLIMSMYIPKAAETGEASESPEHVADTSVAINAEEGEVPPAYPLVQPMKAALYFDSAVGFGEWRILISTRADRDLRQARNRSPDIFRIIIKKIKELSKGHFSDDNQKRLTGLNVEIPIYEAKMTGDTRLVYQVDCVPEFESDVERQVLRIFGIYTHAQLDRRFWDCMSRQLERKGVEYKKRCIFRNQPAARGDYVVLPASWPPPVEPVALEPAPLFTELRKEDLEELHSLLVLEKFVTFSQALLNSILANQDVAHVFDVSPYEKKIIEHPSSCFVLGRSGTGKTTTMLFKMLGIERSWESHREAMPKPRQLFVTQSRVLAEKVEEYFAKLLESLATATQSPSELKKLADRKRTQEQQGLVDRDEEIYWRGDLPKRYGALEEEHFPMFLTYDHICRLLEAEFHHTSCETTKEAAVSQAMRDVLELRDPQGPDGALSNDYMQQRRASFVSYGSFLEEYWSHFPQAWTKGLDPSLVFGEFMGVLKGSEQALDHPEGYLDRDTYLQLSHRTQATFASQRENIYKLFKAYLKRKRERGDYDAADRTHALINCLKTMGVPGQAVDFIYVDEAQDNLLIDAVVLRTLCRNPHGMFWAGDTAQTISVGSAFRFNDLKAFLYRYEEASVLGDNNKRTQPESFHLAVNYRSHAGIVDCAYSVIELITEFWPHAIDSLGRETGMVEGLKPVFFSGWDQNTVRYEQFLFGASGSHIEFGAQQCILVRDEAARERLRSQVGDIGLILTLYESKGLEFNDVLLFNFFEDSTVDLSQWRVVLNALQPDQRADHPAPRFEDARHSGVCRELKFLYVAITRARKNLWIADCSEKGEPMRILWTQKNLIQNCDPGTDVPQLAMSSTTEDWAKMALQLFNNRRYMQAMHCYERAGLSREKEVARAYHLREIARSTAVTKGDATRRALAFLSAAEAFVSSAKHAVTEQRAYYRIAGECYVHAGDDSKGARAYLKAAEYTLATLHFRKAGKFNEAVEVVQLHRAQMSESFAGGIIDVSRLYFLRENNIKKARELFDTDDDILEYMDDYGLDVARASFLEHLERYGDAAELHLAEGNTFEAIRLLTLDRNNTRSIQKAMQCLLDGLWSHLPCGTLVNEALVKTDASVAKLLKLADDLINVDAEDDLRLEVSMFRAIARRELSELDIHAKAFFARGNLAAAFLCLDHIFSTPMKLQTMPLVDIPAKLQTFMQYAQILQKFSTDSKVCGNKAIRKMFAILEAKDECFILPKDSYLSQKALENSRSLTPSAQAVELGTSVPRWELEKLLKHVLRSMLLRRVKDENLTLRNLRPLQPCLPYAVFLECHCNLCPRHHINFQDYDAAMFNARVRVVIQQILIYHVLNSVKKSQQEVQAQRHFWLRQLYDALSPSHYKLGAFHLLEPGLIPELQQGFKVVQVWASELLYALKPRSSQADRNILNFAFLTDLTWAARLALYSDAGRASESLRRIPCVTEFRPQQLLRGRDNVYIVHDLLSFMTRDSEHALSRGMLFLDYVLEKNIPIEAALLCDLMEGLCGSYLVALRLRRDGGLHGLTLPKSWTLRLLPNAETLATQNTQLWTMFKNHIGSLLEDIYSGPSWLFVEGRPLRDLGCPWRNIYFARICKVFCLWGYNIQIWGLRSDIVRAISTVRQPGRTYNRLIQPYVNARSWDHLCRAVCNSTSGTPLDELICLFHGSHPLPKAQLRDVRRVVYNRLEDVPWLIKAGGTSVPHAGLRAEATPFIPTRPSAEEVQENEGDEAGAFEGERPDDMNDDVLEQAIDTDNIAHVIDAEQANSGPVAPTDEEIAAATTIARAYRRHAARTRLRTVKPREEKRRRVFDAFFAESHKMVWPHTYYHRLYLGPIPQLYMVAEGLKNHVYDAKNNAKKRLNFVKHLELETVQSVLTQTTRLYKELEKLYKDLGPTAAVHKSRDLEALKAYTVQVQEHLRPIPPDVAEKWKDDWAVAWKAIVEPKKVPQPKPKPALNMDEDDLVAVEDVEALDISFAMDDW